jgi:hypothetical protein
MHCKIRCKVGTSHMLYTDIDLWPSLGLYDELHRASVAYHSKFHDPTQAFIVPAFQVVKVVVI